MFRIVFQVPERHFDFSRGSARRVPERHVELLIKKFQSPAGFRSGDYYKLILVGLAFKQ